ncbi:MAG: hypothetical protein PUD77_07085 [Clostridiales bacterium]|nr:hypothetical protein [Clostridiales bacterium]
MKDAMAKSLKLLVLGAIMIGLLVMLYYNVSNKKKSTSEEDSTTKATVVQELLMHDLEKSYPPTPKEVVKLYSDITQCYYNQTYSDEELEELAKMSMKLMDPELRLNNPEEAYLESLKTEIADKRSQDCKIYSYNTSSSTDVEYYTKDEREMASLYCTYTIRLGTSMGNTTEQFLLRKDEEGHWKILGWLVENVKEESQSD